MILGMLQTIIIYTSQTYFLKYINIFTVCPNIISTTGPQSAKKDKKYFLNTKLVSYSVIVL